MIHHEEDLVETRAVVLCDGQDVQGDPLEGTVDDR
jgi:hypothetical protein